MKTQGQSLRPLREGELQLVAVMVDLGRPQDAMEGELSQSSHPLQSLDDQPFLDIELMLVRHIHPLAAAAFRERQATRPEGKRGGPESFHDFRLSVIRLA